jgi:hypothetical protein
MFFKRVGFYPFRGPDASLTLRNRNTSPSMSVAFGLSLSELRDFQSVKNTIPETTYEAQ